MRGLKRYGSRHDVIWNAIALEEEDRCVGMRKGPIMSRLCLLLKNSGRSLSQTTKRDMVLEKGKPIGQSSCLEPSTETNRTHGHATAHTTTDVYRIIHWGTPSIQGRQNEWQDITMSTDELKAAGQATMSSAQMGIYAYVIIFYLTIKRIH